MLDLLWLVPVLPLAGFLVLGLIGRRLSDRAVAWIGTGSVGLSALLSLGIAARFLTSPPAGESFVQTLWQWWSVGGLEPEIALHLDPLSLVMTLVVTGVGFLIHLYSTEYMAGEEGYSRFFAYLNLFVGMMLLLVLGGDLLLLYLGWEGVGLCSYLLIGFWYEDPANGRAARKAFVVTRIGDVALALGLFLLFTRLGTLEIQTLLERAGAQWEVGSTVALAAAALILGGAVGKSAQLPLQTWLPDAMAGPTPVSALIHAATMVTAGVYLVARTHPLFELAPPVLFAVAVVGAATLLLAAFSALAQDDIKRVLAYSTISQIGYMFLGLGVGAWAAGIFHLMTHAFFKALLFLGAGAVILAQHHEHDITKMGGLRRELPLTFWTFLAASAALAGVPLVTAGFYSKDLILWHAFAGEHGSLWLWGAGLLGAFVTALYIFRVVFLVFLGDLKEPVTHRPGPAIGIPLAVLGILSLVGGFVEIPATLGGVHLFSGLLEPTLPAAEAHGSHATELLLQAVTGAVSLLGILVAWLWFARAGRSVRDLIGGWLARFWKKGWDFDALYDGLIVSPFLAFARWNRRDLVDWIYRGIAALVVSGHRGSRETQTGNLRWYAAALAVGGILILGLIELLEVLG